MNKCAVVLLLLAVIALTTAQRGFVNPNPGVCPPGIRSCAQDCFSDADCKAKHMKCCKTSCGRGIEGQTCVQSVTRSSQPSQTKRGNCPVKPTGQWVCSPNCSVDSDCRGSLKCCRGRCPGSMLCQKPEP